MRLLVTRPQPDAARTADALRRHGHEVMLAPLLAPETVAHPPFANAEAYAGILVTSANALRALDAEEIAALAGRPLLAVGEATAEAARACGFGDVAAAGGDAVSLADEALTRFAGATRPLLYLAAADRARDLETMPALRGVAIETVVIYRMHKAQAFADDIRAALAAGRIDGVLHYSRRTAEAYLDCAVAGGIEAAALAPVQYCLSPAIGEVLSSASAEDVRIAEAPREESLISLVIR